ncbi:LysM domain protein [Rhodobacteraceae bacterium KLH11]|nr:LysM domain protein [Rhodobacteraceae bacterium KLH11]
MIGWLNRPLESVPIKAFTGRCERERMDAKSGSGGSGTFIWGLIAGLVVVLVAGGLYLSGFFGSSQQQAAPETAKPVAQTAPPEPAVAEAQAPETSQPEGDEPEASAPKAEETADETSAADEDEEAAPALAAPVLDQIFVEPDGNALLSGNAEPGAEVSVMLNGEAVHSFTVDQSGQFAEFVSIPFSDDARGLVLETRSGDATTRSDDYLIAALPEPAQPEAADALQDEPTVDIATTQVAEPDPTPDVTEEDTGATRVPEEKTEVANTGAPTTQEAEPIADAQPEQDTAPDQQVAILRSGEEGVELVQPPIVQDTPPEQIALDTIGYSDTGDVELTGRAQEGSAVRLYLNNRLVADLAPAADGKWRGEVEGIDPGVYTLRVDEVAPDGTVASRLETPFKREPVETLRAAETAQPGETPAQTPSIRSVTVQKGDTLWAISRDRFGDGVLYVKLFEANKDAIRDPDLIYPGQIFTIPE